MTTPITVKNKVGRPINPHQHPANYTGLESGLSMNEFVYNEFEQSVKEHDAPNIPDTKEGEFVEAELVWQERTHGGNWINVDEPAGDYQSRQIYRLIFQQPKEQEKEKTAADIWTNVIKRSTSQSTRISELEARVKELEGALSEAKRTIKNWHDISGGKEWDIYNKHSPEMKTINNALKVNKDKE